MAGRFQTPNEFFVDLNGVPLAGGLLYFFASGTSTPLDTFSDSGLTIPNTNPVVLDADGRAGNVFLQALPYKVRLEDVNNVQQWTADPVTAPGTGSISTAGGNLTGTLNFIMGASVQAAATTSIWGLTDGNSRHITGSGATIAAWGSPVQAGQLQVVIFDGSNVLHQNSNFNVRNNGNDYTTQTGDTFWLLTDSNGATDVVAYALQSGLTMAAGGGGGGSNGSTGIIGSSTNLIATRTSATVLAVSADEAIVKTALGGTGYLGASISTAINFATTGANGLDTGAVAASSFYGWYFIYNPTTNIFAALASLSFTAPTMPSGYTAKALMGVVGTDGSASIRAGFRQYGRSCWLTPVQIFTGHASSLSLISQSVAAAVPSIAKTVSGLLGSTASEGTGISNDLAVAADANGTAGQYFTPVFGNSITPQGYTAVASFVGLPLATAQALFWAGNASGQQMHVTGYSI